MVIFSEKSNPRHDKYSDTFVYSICHPSDGVIEFVGHAPLQHLKKKNRPASGILVQNLLGHYDNILWECGYIPDLAYEIQQDLAKGVTDGMKFYQKMVFPAKIIVLYDWIWEARGRLDRSAKIFLQCS